MAFGLAGGACMRSETGSCGKGVPPEAEPETVADRLQAASAQLEDALAKLDAADAPAHIGAQVQTALDYLREMIAKAG